MKIWKQVLNKINKIHKKNGSAGRIEKGLKFDTIAVIKIGEIIINYIFSIFDFDQTLIKSHPNYKKLITFSNIMH